MNWLNNKKIKYFYFVLSCLKLVSCQPPFELAHLVVIVHSIHSFFITRFFWWKHNKILPRLCHLCPWVPSSQRNYLQGFKTRKYSFRWKNNQSVCFKNFKFRSWGLCEDGRFWILKAAWQREQNLDILWHPGVCCARNNS